ncbi:uncharacterized protein [Blastocystis hominis]|uniref:Histone-binding protein RBBP4-like N-terminal domain-containing protein n=1 Tax=Blastocystis hominis TaxID=12968 RepID=D8M588_BLAHO|nr:uncharacterized protein [Blastocystis hominis]CBK23227.2 unnamed protein product [Blastocystis hominis]|eukprot:XP_012897275.1 uncharacterized protein [Blastocystis hominis]
MESSDNDSYSEGGKKQQADVPASDERVESTNVEADEAEDEELSPYNIWKTNAQFLYDLLLHHHTQWPCTSCSWGQIINESNTSSVAPLSQVVFLSTHTDGTYNEGLRKWNNSPEAIVMAAVEMTRRRGTQTWFIGKFNENQRNRNFVNVKNIIHPNDVSRVKTIPGSAWVVSHSTDSNVFLWNSETQGNHVNREGSTSSIPDIM